MPVGQDADDAQDRYADHLPGTTHAQSEAVEIDEDHVEVSERTRPPRLQPVLQRGHHARHRALREGRGLEQRLERAANPASVAARQISGDDRFIDFRHSPLIARDDRRRPFCRAGASEEGGPRQRERNRASRSRERPLLDAIAVATSDFAALVRTRAERGPQLLVHGHLDRDADVLVDQFAERDGLKLLRSDRLADTLAHGAFLRWPPCQAAVGRALHQPEECATSLFSTRPGTRPDGGQMWYCETCKKAIERMQKLHDFTDATSRTA